MKNGAVVNVRMVKDFGCFTRRTRSLKLGLAFFENFEVIYIYDTADPHYGYAVNVQIGEFSEWGYAPFA